MDRRIAGPQQRDQARSTLRSLLSRDPNPPAIVVWPEVPAPFYYYDDPHFRDYVDGLARSATPIC